MNVRLLKRIVTAIKKEPLRFNMDHWIDSRDTLSPCRTTACIAGYAVILSQQKPGKGWAKTASEARADVDGQARTLLRLEYREAERLFYLYHWPGHLGQRFEEANTREEQAKVAVERIEHFIKTDGTE